MALYLRLGNTKFPIAVVLCLFTAFFIFLKKVRGEKSEGNSEPATGDDGNYSYNRTGTPQTASFKSADFDCKDGSKVPAAYYGNLQYLMNQLQILSAHLDTPIHINSGYRTPAYNARLNGSAKNSQHLLGKAADITAIGYTAAKMHQRIEELISKGILHNGGLGLYGSFVHYDVRKGPVRWRG